MSWHDITLKLVSEQNGWQFEIDIFDEHFHILIQISLMFVRNYPFEKSLMGSLIHVISYHPDQLPSRHIT